MGMGTIIQRLSWAIERNPIHSPGMEKERVEAALPIELVEIRPGRSLAIHRRGGDAIHRLFFVHGSCASMLQYHALIEHFADGGHEVIAFDFFGCGRSPKPDTWNAYGFAELRLDLAAVVERYGGSEGCSRQNVLVCHSAGCALGLGLVGSGSVPSRIHGMCLLGGFATIPPMPPIFYLPRIVLDWLQPKLSAGFEGLALHEKTRAAATDRRRAVLTLVRESNGSNAMYMCKAYYRQLTAPTTDEIRLAGVRTPIMLIAGSDDKIISLPQVEALKALLPSGTQLRIVPESSHQMMQEEPIAVGELVEEFLATLDS